MKKLFLPPILSILLILSIIPCQAQTTTQPNLLPALTNLESATSPQTTVFQTLSSWMTSSNPALTNTFSTNKSFTIETGAEYVGGRDVAETFILEYNFGRFSAESETRNAGIAGIVLSQEIGFGYSVQATVDLRLRGFVDLGYNFDQKCGMSEIGIEAQKGLTDNTFAYIRFSEGILFKSSALQTPTIGAGVGITF